jgi:hypothetical protein
MTAIFNPGDAVQVLSGSPPGHIRTPFYVRGCKGRIERIAGEYRNPEELAFGRFDAPIVPLYRVRFQQQDVWPDYQGNSGDTLDVEIFEFWLEPSTKVKT